ncbi:DUF4433 domain-containing protein [Mesorhizobium sp. P16.1]|uniref:DUF4433 domain-containing protein n=1 Tax=unclassified Mesorhizobium TaxID=325217 RepID=UPI0021A76B33|nr:MULTISPECIES: DUF4433 domain-containing protein [unclassified Mesorhizobium]MCT2580914.1 DUF4433 domain-containing protein [Mesorhizobium sp. P13.3]MDF3169947.1 DUF4433 domain-containing protein [Mesorhizobium sp. P16.1]MDF3181443.1 DUF4433 domain-containing protein [Mesorhizobium sp. P17.1]MDF3186906.1 DUF4433 domain-containing protein [Mesorhizobium sp. ICCV3110.1]
MARRKDYGEIIAEHIAAIVEARQIEDVLHFTRLENLPGILEHGLRTRSELVSADFPVYASDADRLDKEDDAVSVSISCYYPRMFEAKRYRSGDKPWAILILHPNLLWNYHCLFFRKGAATNATKYENGKRYGGYALEKLFDDCSLLMDPNKTGFRAEYGLLPSWPTFSDSEVQVMSPIHPGYIRGAWVEKPEHGEFVREVFKAAGREDGGIVIQTFEPRICRKPYYWG